MFTVNVSGNTVAELKTNVRKLSEELNGIPELPVQSVRTMGAVAEAMTRTPLPKLGKEVVVDINTPLDILKDLPFKPVEVFGHDPDPAPVTPVPQESSVDGVDISDMDKDGRVWDERIDGPLKTKDRFGRWKKRIGVTAEDRFRVIEELKGNVKPESKVYPADPEPQVTVQETEPEAPAIPKDQMTLEHFGHNFPSVMSELFNSGKITAQKTQALCEKARVAQAWQIPLNETSLKAVYMDLVSEGLI